MMRRYGLLVFAVAKCDKLQKYDITYHQQQDSGSVRRTHKSWSVIFDGLTETLHPNSNNKFSKTLAKNAST